MKTKTTKNEKLVLEYIIKITKVAGEFILSNGMIMHATKLTESQVNSALKKLNEQVWFVKNKKALFNQRGGWSGTARTITINMEEANNYLKTL